jgi:hypothetical protein
MWRASKTGLGLVYPGFKQINHFVCLASITKIGYSFLSSSKLNHAKQSSSRSAPLFVYVIQVWICLSHLCLPHAFFISSASYSESEFRGREVFGGIDLPPNRDSSYFYRGVDSGFAALFWPSSYFRQDSWIPSPQ